MALLFAYGLCTTIVGFYGGLAPPPGENIGVMAATVYLASDRRICLVRRRFRPILEPLKTIPCRRARWRGPPAVRVRIAYGWHLHSFENQGHLDKLQRCVAWPPSPFIHRCRSVRVWLQRHSSIGIAIGVCRHSCYHYGLKVIGKATG